MQAVQAAVELPDSQSGAGLPPAGTRAAGLTGAGAFDG